MSSTWINRRWVFVWPAVCAALACGNQGGGSAGTLSEPELGSLSIPLVTPEEEQFRLESALFDISRLGSPVVTLDSDADPDATSLDAELLQGTYSIELRDGWVLESAAPDGGVSTPVSAALLSLNPREFEIEDAEVTELVYEFTTDQGVVRFGRGVGSVSVAVAPTAPSAECSVLDRTSCPNGRTCLLAGDSGRTFCAQPGSLRAGSPCTSDQCVAGTQCLALDPESPDERVCARFCNPDSVFCGCQGLAGNPEIGICPSGASTDVVFNHTFDVGGVEVSCGAWNTFVNELTGDSFGRVTLAGSLDGQFECSDPLAASRICNALRIGDAVNESCDGHVWTVGECGGTEVSVDTSFCSCTVPGNSLRACNQGAFGGIGTPTCSQVPQTITLTCTLDSVPQPR
jgi:hypothetical protein